MSDKPAALIVEDDVLQRELIAALLEENMSVFQCESGEAAELILGHIGGVLCFLFTDNNLSGPMTGVELATIAKRRFPGLRVIITSGGRVPALPTGTSFMKKPWKPLELLREVEAVCGKVT